MCLMNGGEKLITAGLCVGVGLEGPSPLHCALVSRWHQHMVRADTVTAPGCGAVVDRVVYYLYVPNGSFRASDVLPPVGAAPYLREIYVATGTLYVYFIYIFLTTFLLVLSFFLFFLFFFFSCCCCCCCC